MLCLGHPTCHADTRTFESMCCISRHLRRKYLFHQHINGDYTVPWPLLGIKTNAVVHMRHDTQHVTPNAVYLCFVAILVFPVAHDYQIYSLLLRNDVHTSVAETPVLCHFFMLQTFKQIEYHLGSKCGATKVRCHNAFCSKLWIYVASRACSSGDLPYVVIVAYG